MAHTKYTYTIAEEKALKKNLAKLSSKILLKKQFMENHKDVLPKLLYRKNIKHYQKTLSAIVYLLSVDRLNL